MVKETFFYFYIFMQKLLTIVVPVYKVEKYIIKCLDSLILPESQMEKLEVIVVNDGTPDNSAIMAKNYEKRYPNTFHVIDKENGGHGSAWNKGVVLATGKYLRFLDSDDWLTNLSDHLFFLENQDSDIIFTDMNEYNESTGITSLINTRIMKKSEETKISEYDWLYHGIDPKIFDFWFCTYKTSIFKIIHPLFLEKQFYDDSILFVAPAIMANTFIYQPLVVYNYLVGRIGQTISLESKKAHASDYIKVCKSMIDFAFKHPYNDGFKKSFIDYRLNLYVRNTFLWINLMPKKDLQHAMNNLWYPYVLEYFPAYKESKPIKLYKCLPFWAYKLFFDFYLKKKIP